MPNNADVADVIVIGAGLHGMATALHLARAGLRPLVLEKDYPGRHASGVNAGGVRRLGRDIAEIPLSLAAHRLWHRIEELVDDDCGFSACGQIKIAETESELATLAERVARLRRLGFEHEQLIDGAQLREIVPAAAAHCAGAIWCPDDGAANPYRTVLAFQRKLRALGVTLRHDTPVTGLRRGGSTWRVSSGAEHFEAPVVVNAAGAWGGEICRRVGDRAPLTAGAFMLMITERLRPFLKPVLGAAGRTLSFKQFANGTVLIGGGYQGRAEPGRNLSWTRVAGLSASARTVQALFPQLENVSVVRFWAGIEGVTPDGIPVIGPSAAAEDCYHLFGFCGHGYQLSPAAGKLIAELIVGAENTLAIDAFRIGRFDSNEGLTDGSRALSVC